MKVDIVIIASSRDCDIRDMTQICINSCQESSKNIDFNIIVVETYSETKYNNAKVFIFKQNKFNYNLSLNFGASKCDSKYIGFFNNDVFFKKGWCEELINQIKKNKIYSASPYCEKPNIPKIGNKDINIGYNIRQQLLGWGIFMDRKVLKQIGGFKTDVDFWYSDNIYADQLKASKLKHMICYNSIVNHLENMTLNKIPKAEKILKTHYQKKNYIKTLEKNKYRFSVILPSYLGKYMGNESNTKEKKEKLRRAIKSVLNQAYKNWELIIIADGCQNTISVYQEFSEHENIICLEMKKQKLFSGYVRQAGIDKAGGELIIYLDSDDYYSRNHLKNIHKNFKSNWCYYNDYVNRKIRNVELEVNHIGTSCICHKRSLGVSWIGCDGYGHDWVFINDLMKHEGHKINGGQYNVCHIPKVLDI